MSVSAIREQLQTALSRTNLRELQYTNYVVEMLFERSLIQDEIYNSLLQHLEQGRYTIGLTQKELKTIKGAAAHGAKTSYTRKNIIGAHKRAGYKVYTFGSKTKVLPKMKKYAGMRNRPDGRTLPRSNKKLACYIPGGGFTDLRLLPKGLGVNANSIPVTYAGMSAEPNDPANLKVHRELFRNALRHSLTFMGKFKGRGNYVPGAKEGGKHRFRRLHGPIASKDSAGVPTGANNDTSAPLVAVVEALRDIDPSRAKIPSNIKSPAMYSKAHADIISGLDAEFTINSVKISDILSLNNTIEIGMALGGDVHQGLMSHADKKNLEDVLDKLVENLIAASANQDYIASKGLTQRSGELVGAIAIKELLNLKWWNKPNMRLKVNKRLQKAGGSEKEMSKAIEAVILAGSIKTKTSKARSSGTKRHKKSNNQRAREGIAKQQMNPLALKNLINSVLPQAVAMKMQPPALRYRTGRFANSARVTQVMQGPRGGLSADYTYMRNPYETFEPGNKMGSTQRDPRKIIGQTIREIVAQAMQSKFIKTRRV
jgi:hypothetical protein